MSESDEYQHPSKSQRKRDMHELQELGQALVRLSAERLSKIEMPESLRDAVREAQRIHKHEALRRQMQYIGRLMRDADPAPIRAALDAINGVSRTETARLHRLERLRERLIEDESVMTEIGDMYPGADLQRLHQLRRNAIKEHEQNRPARSFREIFRMLRDLDSGEAGVDDEDWTSNEDDEAAS